MYKRIIPVILLLVTFTAKAQKMDKRFANKKTMSFALVEEIDSKALGEKRVLNVYLPYGYDPDSAQTYPTIYVLDGTAHEDFPHIAGLAQFMNMYDLLPKSIVVGIANKGRSRYRDFTHPTTDSAERKRLPQAGGSPQFIAYVANEVIPLIKKNYKTNGQRTIIGQSLGGLLATEFLMKKSDLFNDYIIVSPSLWWSKMKLVKKAKKYFKDNQQLKKRVYVSLGKEHPVMHKVADKLIDAIKKSGNKKLKVYYKPILTEDHATILHKAVYEAFETFYPKKREKY
ncbi:esterase [marine bacterium AO1-C]|nr:esterase [marine bacterium AO1-C]